MRIVRRTLSTLLRSSAIVVLGASASFCHLSIAAEQFYAGLGLGYSRGGTCEVTAVLQGTTHTARQCKRTSIEPKIYGGYLFNDYVGIEFGYTALNTTKFTLTSGDTGKFEASGLPVQAVMFLPQGSHLTWIGKFGLLRWNAKITSTFAANESDSGFSVAAGIGAEYRLTRYLSVRGEIEYFPKVGDENTVGETDIGLLGVSAKWSF